MNRKQLVVIMQGAPGGGKSTLAQAILKSISIPGNSFSGSGIIVSADSFMYEDGVYKFHPSKLPSCHRQCQETFVKYLDSGYTVIVDNTNIRKKDAQFYLDYARNKGIPVQVVRCTSNFKNVHGVPDEKVESMKANLEDLL